jgi:ERCC4-type nuclease
MLPEKHGVDYLWNAHGGWAGVQRKELNDLLASVRDGRLTRELAMMGALTFKWLVVEGSIKFTGEGHLIQSRGRGRGQTWTRDQWEGLLASVQARGCWVTYTSSVADTGRVLEILQRWTRKPKHSTLDGRPGPMSMWGKPGSREWAIHLLQGFEGIGPELAGRIFDACGGVPMRWSVDAKTLRAIDGLGPKKVAALIGALNG